MARLFISQQISSHSGSVQFEVAFCSFGNKTILTGVVIIRRSYFLTPDRSVTGSVTFTEPDSPTAKKEK